MPAWLLLALAVACEAAGTLALRYADGFTKPLPTVAGLGCLGGAFFLVSRALLTLDLGLTYAVWAGGGTVAVALLGVIAFRERVTTLKIASIAAVVAGITVLNLAG